MGSRADHEMTDKWSSSGSKSFSPFDACWILVPSSAPFTCMRIEDHDGRQTHRDDSHDGMGSARCAASACQRGEPQLQWSRSNTSNGLGKMYCSSDLTSS